MAAPIIGDPILVGGPSLISVGTGSGECVRAVREHFVERAKQKQEVRQSMIADLDKAD